MVSDSITNRSIPIASSNPKDFAKKKRANRSAKLKQCKLDARREQWLSQVKNKGLKEETNNGGSRGAAKNVVNERERLIEKLEIKPRVEEDNEGLVHHCSDYDSPTSQTSSVLGGNDSGTNFTGSSSGSSSSSSSGGCCSGSVSEEDEEEDDDCLDDWEAVGRKQQQDALPKYANPVLLSADVRRKAEALDRVCRPIMTKPKPAKPTTPEAPSPQTPQGGEQQPQGAESPNAGNANATEGANAGSGVPPAAEPMEMDKSETQPSAS